MFESVAYTSRRIVNAFFKVCFKIAFKHCTRVAIPPGPVRTNMFSIWLIPCKCLADVWKCCSKAWLLLTHSGVLLTWCFDFSSRLPLYGPQKHCTRVAVPAFLHTGLASTSSRMCEWVHVHLFAVCLFVFALQRSNVCKCLAAVWVETFWLYGLVHRTPS